MTEKFDSHANAVVKLCQLTDIRYSSRNPSVALANWSRFTPLGQPSGLFLDLSTEHYLSTRTLVIRVLDNYAKVLSQFK